MTGSDRCFRLNERSHVSYFMWSLSNFLLFSHHFVSHSCIFICVTKPPLLILTVTNWSVKIFLIVKPQSKQKRMDNLKMMSNYDLMKVTILFCLPLRIFILLLFVFILKLMWIWKELVPLNLLDEFKFHLSSLLSGTFASSIAADLSCNSRLFPEGGSLIKLKRLPLPRVWQWGTEKPCQPA